MRSALSLDLSFGHITLVHYRLMGTIELQNAWTWTCFSDFPGAIVYWFILDSALCTSKWGYLRTTSWTSMGIQISRIVIPQKNNQKIVDPQKRDVEKCGSTKKMWRLKVKIVDPQKVKLKFCGSTKSQVEILWIHKSTKRKGFLFRQLKRMLLNQFLGRFSSKASRDKIVFEKKTR